MATSLLIFLNPLSPRAQAEKTAKAPLISPLHFRKHAQEHVQVSYCLLHINSFASHFEFPAKNRIAPLRNPRHFFDTRQGLFGRGLSTRILANGLQSMLFTVVWRYLHDKYVVPRREAAESREAKDRGGAQQRRRQRLPTASPRLGRNGRSRRS